MRPFKQSLTARLAVSFLIMALPLVVVVSGLTYGLVRRASTVATIGEIETAWEFQKDALQAWTSEQTRYAQALAVSPYLLRLAEKIIRAPFPSAEHAALRNQLLEELAPQLRLQSQFGQLLLLDPVQGRVCFATESALEGKSLASEASFSQPTPKLYLRKEHAAAAQEPAKLALALPLWPVSGQAGAQKLGLLIIQLNQERLVELVTSAAQAKPPLAAYLIDHEYGLVAATRPEQPRPPQGWQSPSIKLALSGVRGSTSYLNHHQMPVIGTYGLVPELGLALLVEAPQQRADAPARRLASLLAGGGALFTLLLAGLIWRLGRQWVEPLRASETVAIKAASGERAEPLSMPAHAEIGAVAHSVNNLIEKLDVVKHEFRQERSQCEPAAALHHADRQAEHSLQPSEELFRTLAASSQAAIAIHDDERFLYANPAAEELYGYPNVALAQLSPWELVHPDSRAIVDELRAALRRENPAPWRDEFKIITRQGAVCWVDTAVGFINLEGRRCCIAISFDITSRKETKEALRISEERFAVAFNASPEAMALSTFSEGRLVLVNDAWLRLWGLAREAVLGRPLAEFNLWADPAQGATAEQLVRQTGALHNFEAQVYLAGGELGDILLSAEVVELGTERLVLSVSKNITERKRAEAAIQASETRFRTLTESSPTAILIFDEARFYYVNPAAEEMFGYTQAEFAQLSMRHLLHPSSWLGIRQRQEAHRRGESVSQRHEVRIVTKTGQKRWIDYSSAIIELDGQPRYIVTASDITKRKRAEAAIQASEIRFRTLAESSQAAILIFDDKHYLYSNPAASKLFEYSERELRRLSLRQLLHPDSYAVIEQYFIAREHGEPVPTRNEVLIITNSGAHRWVDYSLGIAEMDGKPRYIVTALDITQRRRMEAALQASEARFRTLTETSQAAITIYDGEQFMYVNPAAERLFGYSLTELREKNIWDVVHPDSLGYVQHLQTAFAQGTLSSMRSEVKISRQDGQVRWIDNAGAQIEMDGKLLRIATSFDITERKQAEEALRLSEERFALTFDACPDAMALTTYKGGAYVMVNQAWLNFFGLVRAQVISKNFAELEIWGTHEQRQYVYRTVRERGAFRNFEVKIRRANGEAAYLLVSAEVVQLGQEQFVLSVSKDITERKRVEAALQASEAKFRTLAETSQAATLIHDDERFIYANPAAEKLLCYPQSELTKLTLWDILHPDSRKQLANDGAAWQRGAALPLQDELKVQTKPGEARWINAAVALIQIGGKPYRLVTAFDVTERRQAEEDLRVSQEQLRHLAARLQDVREEERAAISREIHDELGQALTGMKMDLKWLEKQLPEKTPALQQRLASLYELINTTIQNVRRLASSLRPGVLDDFGLVAALEWLAQDFTKRTGITCHLREMPEDFPLERERATAVFRISQEALTNITRHAEATQVEVYLSNDETQLCLEVRDNGKGITADQINHIRSLGLVGMRERALLLGGAFNISGTPGVGTTVTVQIPHNVTPGGPHDAHLDRG
jgi:PAS domain S-box-containing protein